MPTLQMAQPSGFIHLFMPDQTQRCMLQLLLQQNAPMNNKSQHKEVSPAARMTLKSLLKVSLRVFRAFFFFKLEHSSVSAVLVWTLVIVFTIPGSDVLFLPNTGWAAFSNSSC